MPEFVRRTHTTSRLKMGYLEQGDTDGLPLVLLHGSFATSRWWERFMEVLPPAVHVLAPDLRGCGATDRPTTGYSIEEMAEDVAVLLDELGWDDVDLVGHASGGAMAIELALTRPGLLRTLILVDSAPVEGVFTPIDTFMVLEEMRSDEALLRQGIAALMPSLDVDGEDRELFEQLVADAQTMAPPVFTEIAAALGRWNRFADARRLTLPTVLIWGDQDIIVDRDATTRMLIALPGANNLEILRGVGHAPMLEAPVALAERIIDFMTDEFEDFAEVREIGEEGDAPAEDSTDDAPPSAA